MSVNPTCFSSLITIVIVEHVIECPVLGYYICSILFLFAIEQRKNMDNLFLEQLNIFISFVRSLWAWDAAKQLRLPSMHETPCLSPALQELLD